jgi:hypothetical protein
MLRRRAARMHEERVDLSVPVAWESEREREACVAFFNAAFRAEESGLTQAHALADQLSARDPELGECLRLYGDEEGWHRQLLTAFLASIGGEVRPMGPTTRTFYRLYGRAERVDTIVLTNLMFETIGSTTYRLALRHVRAHPTMAAVRHMLTILTRDESFHVPLNVHFLRECQRLGFASHPRRRQALYDVLFGALLASAYASRRRALAFDHIPFPTLARAYAEQLGKLFLHEADLRLRPPTPLLWAAGLTKSGLLRDPHPSAVSIEAAEAAVERDQVVVDAL